MCSRWSVPFQSDSGILTNALDGLVSEKNLEGIVIPNLGDFGGFRKLLVKKAGGSKVFPPNASGRSVREQR